MGLFDFLKKVEYPPLDGGSEAAGLIGKFKAQIEEFVVKVNDKLELVPTREVMYFFVGKPPGAFGVAWIDGTGVHNFKTLMQQKGLSQMDVQVMSDNLREAYVKSKESPRYCTKAGGKDLTVTPSEVLASEVSRIIHQTEGK